MPWKSGTIMDSRLEFVRLAEQGGVTVAELCASCNVRRRFPGSDKVSVISDDRTAATSCVTLSTQAGMSIVTQMAIVDNTKHAGSIITMKPYTGTVAGITSEYISASADSLILTALGPNVFIYGGTGEDVIAAQSGRNILDGGSGSNFLVGGSGTDTFYLDARSDSFTWNTIVNFHHTDDVTIWGWQPGVSTATWVANLGAQGFTGATLKIDINGKGAVTDQLTFAGYSVAQASQFVQAAGTVAGNPYLHIST